MEGLETGKPQWNQTLRSKIEYSPATKHQLKYHVTKFSGNPGLS